MSRSSFTIAGSIGAAVAACLLAGCGSSENAQIVAAPPTAPSTSASATPGVVSGFEQDQSRQLSQAMGTVGVPAHVKHVRTPAAHLKLPH